MTRTLIAPIVPCGGVTRSAIVALWLLSACGAPAPREFRVGVLAASGPLMGPSSGTPSLEGARMAVDEINAAGGVLIDGRRHRVVMIEKNFGEDSAQAAEGARTLIVRDSVHAIVGPQYSEHALAAAPVAEAHGVPMLSPMSSSPLLTANRRFVSRLAMLDEMQGTIIARYARRNLKAQRAAALHDEESAMGRNAADFFLRTFVSLGGELLRVETFRRDAGSDVEPVLRRIVASQPDVLLLPDLRGSDSLQLRRLRALGFRGPFLGNDRWDTASLRHLPESVGAIIVHQWNAASPDSASVAFVAAYRERFGNDPRVTAAATYDAVRLLAHAAARARSLDGALLADSLRTTDAFAGAAATYRFTGNGNPDRGAVLVRVGATRDSLVAVTQPQ